MRNLSDSRMMMTRRLHHLVLLCTCLTIPLLHAQTAETVPTPEQYDFIAAQIERAEAQEALDQLEQVLDDLTASAGRFSPELIRPLALKGEALMALGDSASAIDHFDQAIHISRIENGLFTPNQVDFVYRQADGYRAMGDQEQAQRREEYAFRIISRNAASGDLDIVAPTLRLANHYLKNLNFIAARTLFSQGVRTVGQSGQSDQEALVPFLDGLAKTYLLERFPPLSRSVDERGSAIYSPSLSQIDLTGSAITLNNFPAGERALQQVVRIRQAQLRALMPKPVESDIPEGADAQNETAQDDVVKDDVAKDDVAKDEVVMDEVTQNVVAQGSATEAKKAVAEGDLAEAISALQLAFLGLADWHTMFANQREAAALYGEVYRMQADLPEARQLDVSSPLLLYLPQPSGPRPPGVEDRLPQEIGHVRLALNVRSSGRVQKMVTVDTHPDPRLEFKVRRSMRDAIFRPAMDDGVPTLFEDYEYLYRYPYFPSRKARAKAAAKAQEAAAEAQEAESPPEPDNEAGSDANEQQGDGSDTPAPTPGVTA